MPRRLAPPLFILAASLLLVLAGCARTPPLQRPIDAETPMALTLWRAGMVHELTPEEWRWFDVVVQEYKLEFMRAGQATGAAALDDAVRRALHGRPLADVMREGLQRWLQRKTAERDEMTTAFERNEQKRPLIAPTQTGLLRDLDFHQQELRRKIERCTDEIAAGSTALQAFEAKTAR